MIGVIICFKLNLFGLLFDNSLIKENGYYKFDLIFEKRKGGDYVLFGKSFFMIVGIYLYLRVVKK